MSKIIQNFKNISYGPAPEDSKDVMSWINSLNKPNHLFINGVWVKSKSSKKIQVINPASNKKLTTLSISNKNDVNAAVGAAKKAFNSWSKTSSDMRAKYLRIGASSLLIDIERQLYHFALGRYANKEKLAIG